MPRYSPAVIEPKWQAYWAEHKTFKTGNPGDKGFDTRAFVAGCRDLLLTPHVAQKQRSAVDARTTRHAGYAISQRFRKRIEEVFGWMKTIGGFRKTRMKGIARTQLAAYLVGAAYNLIRISKLLVAPPVAT